MDEAVLTDRLTMGLTSAEVPDHQPETPGADLAGSTAIIVLGMHRSGTSALAGMLHHMGVALGDNLMPATQDNPRGYWEHRDIVAINERFMTALGRAWHDVRPWLTVTECAAAWTPARSEIEAVLQRDFSGASLWGLKDPRLCRLLPLWLELLTGQGVKPRFILALRHPLDVVGSLQKRDGLSAAHAYLLWLRHVLEAERGSRGYPRITVHYEELFAPGGWRGVAAGFARQFGPAWPAMTPEAEGAIDAYLEPELRRNRVSDSVAAMPVWIEQVYAAFRDSPDALTRICDVVRAELDHSDGLFAPLVGEAMQALGELHAQRQAQDRAYGDLATRLTRAQKEVTELRSAAEKLLAVPPAPTPQQQPAVVNVEGRALAQPLQTEDAFPRWVANRTSIAALRPEWVAERIAEWPFAPVLALGMLCSAGNETRVALTLRALLLQTIGDWQLHVVADGEMPEVFAAEPRLVWHRVERRSTELLNRALIESGAHWIALIDAGDQLPPHALFTVADTFFRHPEWQAFYSDEARIDFNDNLSAPHFKPDFNLDLLRGLPYVGGLLAVRHDTFAALGGFDTHWDGIEEYDLALRLAERVGSAGFGHVADVLYHRLSVSGRSTRPIEQICADMPKVVQAHLNRVGVAATAETGSMPHACRVRYRHDGVEPLVSIIIPTKNQLGFLKRCVETVLQKTEYQNYEIIVVDNGSTEADACAYLQNIEEKLDDIGGRIRVLRHPGPFNYSAMNNRAVREQAQGEYLCLLNNDTAPLDGAWLGEMMELARRPDVGVVGAKLFFPDGTIQHGGVLLGVGWGAAADHPYMREPGNSFGYWGRLQVPQSFSAVTAACLVTRRSLYEEVSGLDEEAFAVSFNDVDYCLKIREAGHLVVWTPYARLLHEAGASQRSAVETKTVAEKNARFGREGLAMFRKWMPQIARDPAHNRNLSARGFGFAIETEAAPTWDPDFRPRPRVLVYPADREGCGEYRIISPSRALLKSGRVQAYETMRLFTPPEVARIAPDSVVFQRQLEWAQIDVIERVKNTNSTFRVFEIDDLITNLPAKSPHRQTMAPDIAERLKKALALCNRLVVSTEPLAKHYGRFCDETVVRANRLEKVRWEGIEAGRRNGGKPRVGWAGAIGHLGDLSIIASVVEATAKEIDWVFLGMCPERLRRHVAEYHEWGPLDEYPRRLAALDLDLAVAPLEPHPFNECKSNLRLLEYGIVGYPVLCTDIVPYQGDLPVMRVRNRHQDWVKAVHELTADRDACRKAGETLRQAVLKDWMLEDHLDDVQRAWLP